MVRQTCSESAVTNEKPYLDIAIQSCLGEVRRSHEDCFVIRPAPRQDNDRWLTAGIITKTFDDGDKEHRFVRAETHGGPEEASNFSIIKGKQFVDDLGDRMFKSR